jgi:Trk K+ transport system NAD-binding subunit
MDRPTIGTDAETDPVENATLYVVGGGPVGEATARRLHEDGHDIALLDETRDPADLPSRQVAPDDTNGLSEAGVGTAETVIATTGSDSRNLLVAQLARARFGVDRVVVRTNDPDRLDTIAEGGHEPVCATGSLASGIVETI